MKTRTILAIALLAQLPLYAYAQHTQYAGQQTRDIKALRGIRMVMKGGAVYDPSALYQAVGVKPFVD